MAKLTFSSAAEFKAKAQEFGYTVEEKKNDRIGVFFVAMHKELCAGSFCQKFHRDSFMLEPTDPKFKLGD